MKTALLAVALLSLAACGGPTERPDRGAVIVGVAARGGNLSDLLQFDEVELSWQPLDPTMKPLVVLGRSCTDPANGPAPCVGERMSYFVLAAPAGIYELDHFAVKLGRGIRVRNFRGAERGQIVLFKDSVAYLGDFSFDPGRTVLTGYTRDDAAARAALKSHPDITNPLTFIRATPAGLPRAAPEPIVTPSP